MKTIWKYPIEITDRQTIAMPVDAEILTVAMQGRVPHIWALVDTEEPMEDRRLEVFGTGHPIPFKRGITSRKYIGTFQLDWFVAHVFENLVYEEIEEDVVLHGTGALIIGENVNSRIEKQIREAEGSKITAALESQLFKGGAKRIKA